MPKVKLSKNPDNFLHDYFIEQYIDKLMYSDELDKLPVLVLDYFILKLLYDEVMEGGFEQFIYNHFEYTSRYLEDVFNRVKNEEFKNILIDYLSVLTKTNIVNRCLEDKSLLKIIKEIDDNFYSFDEKNKIEKILKTEYKLGYGDNTLILEIDKPNESKNLRFFTWTKLGVKIEDVVESIKSFIKYFNNNTFNILLTDMLGFLSINISSDNLLPMDNLINEWENDRNNVCYFENFLISNYHENDVEVVRIFKSGLEKNEYFVDKVKHNKTKLNSKNFGSQISISNHNIQSKKDEIQLFYDLLNKAKAELKNINKVEFNGNSLKMNNLFNSMAKMIEDSKFIDDDNKEKLLKMFKKQ